MRMDELDKNFAINNSNFKGTIIDIPSDKVNLYGVTYEEGIGFVRMPSTESHQVSPGVEYLSKHTAGGRIAFSTNSPKIRIHVTYDSLEKMYHMPLTGQAGFVINEVIFNKEYHRHTYSLTFEDTNGYVSENRLFDGKRIHDYVLYFPLYNKVKTLKIEICDDAVLAPYNPYIDMNPIVVYGSSITQGGCASRPDNSYESFISKHLRIDHVNLGFSGNCKGEPYMAKYIGNLKMSMFILDYDHNAPSVEYLKETHESFLFEFRKYQPNTPVIILSAPNYYESPKVYEPRRKVIEETYLNAIKNNDKNVYFIDGRTLYPKEDREFAAVDDAHPNDLGFYFFYKKLNKTIKKILIK